MLSGLMYQALLKAGVKSNIATIPGASHGFTDQADDRAMQETVSRLKEHLKVK
jgi:dipeptidyl aminopeptidase/acylaminoacyl peptidase